MNPLHGTWELVRAESNGEPANDLLALRVELTLRDDTYRVVFAGEVADQGTFSAGASASHASLLLLGTHGANAGRTIPCIYQLVGDRLRVCYGLDGHSPTAFASPAGSSNYLAFYRRKA